MLVEDIPSGLDLDETAVYLMDHYKNTFNKPRAKITPAYLSKLPRLVQKTVAYILNFYKALFQQNKLKIKQEAVIKLSDGTEANHIIIDWQSQTIDLTTVAVIVYTNRKLICAMAHGFADTPLNYLNNMVTSLTFDPAPAD